MSDTQKHDWSNYWQGRAATESGAVLAGAGIETDAEIASFWDGILSGLPEKTKILDLACGAGSILRRAQMAGFNALTGADISEAAIETLKTEFPSVRGVVTSADKTPFETGEFNLVASQFGFEYAGAARTAKEAARLIAPEGMFVAISHKGGGAIEQEVSGKLATANIIAETGFIPAAKALFDVEFSGGDDAAFNKALEAFRPAQDRLLALAKEHGEFAAHLYSGTQQLYQKRQAYSPEDISGWLDGMQNESAAFIGRMQSMMAAALGDEDVKTVCHIFESEGLTTETPEILHLGPKKDEAGWIIRAFRPA